MTRRSFALALALAAGCSAAVPTLGFAQVTGVLSPMTGVHEATAVILGDTLWPRFLIPNSDTALLRPAGGNRVAIVRGCGAPRLNLRIYHPVASLSVPGSFSALNPANPAAVKPTIWGPLTADSTQHQVIDSTATTGACSPAASSGINDSACTIAAGPMIDSSGALQVHPLALPDGCQLTRNRFLATPALDSLIDRFIARTYPAPPAAPPL